MLQVSSDPAVMAAELPSRPEQFAAWTAWLRGVVKKLLAETAAADGRQNGSRWKLARDLARAGANAGWAIASTELGMAGRADMMRFAYAHNMLAAALKISYDPQVTIRDPSDTSELVAAFYGATPDKAEELLTARGRSDLAELVTDFRSLDADRAQTLLIRMPSGVLVWR